MIRHINNEEFIGTFNDQKIQMTNQSEFRIRKVISNESDTLYVKRKSSDNSFNGWIIKFNMF